MLAKKHRTFELKTILQTPLTPQSISGWSRPITSSKYLFIKPTRFPIGIFSPLFLHRKHTYKDTEIPLVTVGPVKIIVNQLEPNVIYNRSEIVDRYLQPFRNKDNTVSIYNLISLYIRPTA